MIFLRIRSWQVIVLCMGLVFAFLTVLLSSNFILTAVSFIFIALFSAFFALTSARELHLEIRGAGEIKNEKHYTLAINLMIACSVLVFVLFLFSFFSAVFG